jgi:small subunit ribosomal protein S3
MGRKVHPVSFRLGIIKDWQSRWYADRNYTDLLHEDVRIRQLVSKRLSNASLSRIEIQRSANQLEVTLHTAKPGVVIGKGGQAVDLLRKDLETMTGKKVKLNIEEIKNPELDAFLVAESIAEQIGRRVSYKRALKQSVMRSLRAGAKGVKIRISGRLGGAEMARSVWEREGRVPLHTIRADIDYGQVHAHTTYGRIGVKVWIYRGDVIERRGGDSLLELDRPLATASPRPERRGDRPERGGRGDGRNEGRRGDGRNERGGGGGGDFRGERRGGERADQRGPRPERPARTERPETAAAEELRAKDATGTASGGEVGGETGNQS